MKKLLLLLFVFPFIFGSCSSDDDDNNNSFNLEGKTYAAYAYDAGGINIGGIYIQPYKVYWVYRFLPDNKVERTARNNEVNGKIIGEIDNGTYILDYPNMKIKLDDSDNYTECVFINENAFRTGSGSNVKEYNKQ